MIIPSLPLGEAFALFALFPVIGLAMLLFGTVRLAADDIDDATALTPPRAKAEPRETAIHGETLVDEFAWLRQRDDPEVIAYLEAENRHTEAVMQPTEVLRDELYKELVGRIQETDISVPARRGAYYYYSRIEAGQQYRIYCRRQGLEAPEEILLDINALAADHGYFRLGALAVSPDHRLLAYAFDTSGDERYQLQIRDLGRDRLLPDTVTDVANMVWSNDNRTLFYATRDETNRPYRVYRHRLGTVVKKDKLLYEETDGRFSLYLTKTRSERFVMVVLSSMTTCEYRYLDADRPDDALTLFQPRRQDVEYYLDHHGDHFYARTNEEARGFRLLRTPIGPADDQLIEEIIPHREHVQLESVLLFAHHMVLIEREAGVRRIRIRNMAAGTERFVVFPETAYGVWPGDNLQHDSRTFRYTYSSLVTPRTVIDVDMDDGAQETKKVDEVPGYDPDLYASERIYARAPDGVAVPISLVYRRGFERDGKSPCLLRAYGSYGATIDATFSASRISLLDRGFVLALAHIRGGGMLGTAWHDDGKMLNKRNTFGDFIAAAEHLITHRYTTTQQLAIQGGSAGGMLIGAVLNMRPELFTAAIANVPFVDVINTMLDDEIPLTVTEFEEWGNPRDETYFRYMRSYSPYDNVSAQRYPHLLITGGLNDPRVQYWEPAKWAARLRVRKVGDNRLLLKTNMGAGHGGASGRYDALSEAAFELAFLLDCLGLTATDSQPGGTS